MIMGLSRYQHVCSRFQYQQNVAVLGTRARTIENFVPFCLVRSFSLSVIAVSESINTVVNPETAVYDLTIDR